MKRILYLIMACLFISAGVMQGQTSGTVYTLPANVTSYTAFSNSHTTKYSATVLKDSIAGTGSKYWDFAINKSGLYYYQFLVEYDTVLIPHRVAGNHVTVHLQGSIDGSYFIDIDTVLFHPTGMWLPTLQTSTAANAILGVASLKDVSTGTLYRYLRIKATGGDANKCAIISKLMVKVGLK